MTSTCPFTRVYQLIFVGFILYFLVHVVNKIRKQKRKYFKQFWNLLELCTVIMAVLTCAMYAAKILFGNTAMDVLRESGSGPSNFHIFTNFTAYTISILEM